MSIHTHSRSVLFQEIDAAGIVFFARFFEWFHDAYSELLASRGIRFEDVLAKGEWGIPLVHAEADYREPLRLGIAITIVIEKIDLGDKSMTVSYSVKGAEKTYAVGKTVHAFIDRKTFRGRAIPDEVRKAFAQ